MIDVRTPAFWKLTFSCSAAFTFPEAETVESTTPLLALVVRVDADAVDVFEPIRKYAPTAPAATATTSIRLNQSRPRLSVPLTGHSR